MSSFDQEAKLEKQNEQNLPSDAPAGIPSDDDYTSRPGQKQAPIPVQKDSDTVESGVDAATADSDAQLEADEKAAIDESNIIGDKTRGAALKGGAYREPGDEEGL
ncbi:hypothetical protein KVT40_000067 [Elsinoe batatas]|uniref:Histone chaperone domain-containing protein n=1 Tax=Elsinoe batatas TaxID=2601811 RepID=A0A8K0L8L1_9PEZI|nr:hypothetical protein KVT40_000067 [Elsinoe batatas]